jgi:hypothetical protein
MASSGDLKHFAFKAHSITVIPIKEQAVKLYLIIVTACLKLPGSMVKVTKEFPLNVASISFSLIRAKDSRSFKKNAFVHFKADSKPSSMLIRNQMTKLNNTPILLKYTSMNK